MQPRPESRISSLEKRATAIEAGIEELSSDTAEELTNILLLLNGVTTTTSTLLLCLSFRIAIRMELPMQRHCKMRKRSWN